MPPHTRFRVERSRALPIHRYHQLDGYSCGFLAAVAVAHYFDPAVPYRAIRRAVPPSPASGCGQRQLIRGLKQLGITAVYRDYLGPKRLAHLLDRGRPVIVTVWPDWYDCDHWTAIRQVDTDAGRVLLSNYDYLDDDGALSWNDFTAIWSPRGGGLVCVQA